MIDIQKAFYGGRQPDFSQLYGGQIKELEGNLSDITRYDNYSDAMKDLEPFTAYHDNLNKINTIKTKLNNIDLTKIPQQKDEQTPVINQDYFEMLPEDQWPDEIKNWHKYTEDLKDDKGNYKKQPATFDEYLQTLGIRDKFAKAHPNAYKTVSTKRDLTDDELKAEYYHAAGLSPEDAQFYEQYGDKISKKDEDEKLQTLITNYLPLLQSSGSMGDSYAKSFQQQVINKSVDEPALTKYEVKVDEKNGDIIYVDPQNPGKYKVIKYADVKKPDEDGKQDWDYNYDEQGNPYWGVWKKDANGQYKFERVADFTNGDKEKLANDKAAFDKKMAGPQHVGRHSAGRKITVKEQFSKMTPDELKAITPDNLKGKDLDYLKNLKDNRSMLSEETGAALDDLLSGKGSTSITKHGPDNWANREGSNQMSLDRENKKQEIRNDGTDEETQSMNNIDDAIGQIIKAWGRDDLTSEEWSKQLSEFNFTAFEKELLKELYGIDL